MLADRAIPITRSHQPPASGVRVAGGYDQYSRRPQGVTHQCEKADRIVYVLDQIEGEYRVEFVREPSQFLVAATYNSHILRSRLFSRARVNFDTEATVAGAQQLEK